MGNDEWEFTEFEGMILLESAEAAERIVRSLQEQDRPFSRWSYERGANHTHSDVSAVARVRVREEMKIAAELERALRQNYPDREFVISHIPGYAVSFYQLIDGAPTAPLLYRDTEETAWCQNCQTGRTYKCRPEPDPEFPWLKWGECTVCGDDLLLEQREYVRVVRTTGRG